LSDGVLVMAVMPLDAAATWSPPDHTPSPTAPHSRALRTVEVKRVRTDKGRPGAPAP